jgi:hypothetical protein
MATEFISVICTDCGGQLFGYQRIEKSSSNVLFVAMITSSMNQKAILPNQVVNLGGSSGLWLLKPVLENHAPISASRWVQSTLV